MHSKQPKDGHVSATFQKKSSEGLPTCTESYARLPPDGGRREGRLISFGSSRSRFCEFDSVGWLDISEEQKHKWAVLMAHHQAYAFLVLGKTIFI